MKKLLCLLLVLTMVLALAGCGGQVSGSGTASGSDSGASSGSASGASSGSGSNSGSGSDPGSASSGEGSGSATGSGSGEDSSGSGEKPGYTIPDPDPLDAYLEQNGFFKGVKASELVTLPAYKGITVPANVVKAADKDVWGNLDYVLSWFDVGEFTPITTGKVEDGMTINIDFSGKMDGVVFEGGTATDQDVTLGFSSFIPGFLEQIVGHEVGETFDIDVTFPEPYLNNLDFSGKDATFTITINYIKELSDEMAVMIGFESRDAFVSFVEESIVETQKDEFFRQLLLNAECASVPENIREAMKLIYLRRFEGEAVYYKESLAETLDYYGYGSEEDFMAEADQYIDGDAVMWLAIQAIAEKEGLTVTTDDIVKAGYEEDVELYGMPYMCLVLLRASVVRDFIFDNAVVE